MGAMSLEHWKSALLALGNAPSLEEWTHLGETLLQALVDCLPESLPDREQSPEAWLPHEIDTWVAAEAIRSCFVTRRIQPGPNGLLDACASIALDRRAGRGRTNMIGVLGSFGGAAYEATFIALLADRKLFGHVLGALQDSGLTAYADETILHYRGDEPSWVALVVADYVRFCADA